MRHVLTLFSLGILLLGLPVAEARRFLASMLITPSTVDLGFNPSTEVLIQCGWIHSLELKSLAIGKFVGTDIVEIATVTQTTPSTITNPSLVTPGSSLTDLFDGSEPILLNLLIPNPGSAQEGRYVCDAEPLSARSASAVRDVFLDLAVAGLDIEDYVSRFEALQDRVDVLVNHLDGVLPYPEQLNFTDDFIDLQNRYDNSSTQLADIVGTLDDIEDANDLWNCRVQALGNTVRAASLVERVFSTSADYNYYMTYGTPNGYNNGAEFCAGLGGELALADTEAELQALLPALSEIIAQDQLLLTGLLIDENGIAVTANGTVVADVEFFSAGQELEEDCVAIAMNYQGEPGIKRESVQCGFLPPIPDTHFKPGYLCRVPRGVASPAVCSNPFSYT